MEKYCTILEAARAAGITKNAAKGRLRKAPAGVTSKGPDGLIRVSEVGVKWLVETEKNRSEPPVPESPVPGESAVKPGKTGSNEEKTSGSKTTGSGSDDAELLIDLLRSTNQLQAEQIREKDRQIAALQKNLDDVTTALQTAQELARAAQAVHIGEIQKSLVAAETASDTGNHPGFWDRFRRNRK